MVDEIGTWRDKIEEAKDERQKYGNSDHWDRYRRYYRSQYKEGEIPVNMTFAIARSIIPQVYFRNPRTITTPNKPGMTLHANVLESLDNWLIHRIGLKTEMKRCVLDTFLYGTSIIKTGYDSEYGYESRETARELSETEQQYQEDYQRYINPFQDRNEYNMNVLPGMPWALRVHPINFGIAPGYISIDSAPWVYHRFYRHIDQVKEDDKYKNTSKLSPTHRKKSYTEQDGEQTKQTMQAGTEDCEYVEMFEISDLRDSSIKVIATGHNEYLRNETDPLLEHGHKYVAMKWNEDTNGFWGIPDVKIIEPQQLELNEARSQFSEHRSLSILKLLVQKGVMNEDQLDKLKNNEVGGIVEVDADVQQAIKELTPRLSLELLNATDYIRRDIRETVGFSRNQLGDYDTSSRRTATEAQIVQQASQIRVDERRDMTADMLVHIIERMNKYIYKYWDSSRVIQVMGREGGGQWIEFTGPQIRGEYDIRVDADTARAVSSEQRKQEAYELLETMSNLPPELVNLPEIVRFVAAQYEGLDESRILNVPQEQPNQQQAVPLAQAAAQQNGTDQALQQALGGGPTSARARTQPGSGPQIEELMSALAGGGME